MISYLKFEIDLLPQVPTNPDVKKSEILNLCLLLSYYLCLQVVWSTFMSALRCQLDIPWQIKPDAVLTYVYLEELGEGREWVRSVTASYCHFPQRAFKFFFALLYVHPYCLLSCSNLSWIWKKLWPLSQKKSLLSLFFWWLKLKAIEKPEYSEES